MCSRAAYPRAASPGRIRTREQAWELAEIYCLELMLVYAGLSVWEIWHRLNSKPSKSQKWPLFLEKYYEKEIQSTDLTLSDICIFFQVEASVTLMLGHLSGTVSPLSPEPCKDRNLSHQSLAILILSDVSCKIPLYGIIWHEFMDSDTEVN